MTAPKTIRPVPSLSRRLLLSSTCLVALELGYLGLGASLGVSLGGCDDATGGQRIRLETVVTSDVAATPTVTTAGGWTVEVTQARLVVGDVLFLAGAPIARGFSPSGLIPSALAHPGHYQAGDVLGEAHPNLAVDLLADETSLGVSEAVSGVAQSASFGFGAAVELDGAVVVLAGVARRAEEADRTFIVHVTAEEVTSSATGRPEVAGCVLAGGQLDADGRVTLTVNVGLWLEQIDFDTVPPSDEAVELVVDEPARNAFVRGVKKAAAYGFAFTQELE